MIEAFRINYIILKQNIIVAKLSTSEMQKNLILYVKLIKLTTNIMSNS